jgi:hypothetical protein
MDFAGGDGWMMPQDYAMYVLPLHAEPVPWSDRLGRNAGWMIGGDLRRVSSRADHRAVPDPALLSVAEDSRRQQARVFKLIETGPEPDAADAA